MEGVSRGREIKGEYENTFINRLMAGRQKSEKTHIKNNKVLMRAPTPFAVSGCWKKIPPTNRPIPKL